MSNYPLNLPDSLKQEAQRRARDDGVSLNQWISVAVAEKIGAAKAADYFTERGQNADQARRLGMLRAAPGTAPIAEDELPE